MTNKDLDNLNTAVQGSSTFYLFGGITAILILVMMLISIVGYIAWPYAAGTTPTVEIFNLIQTNIWAGFIALDLGLSITNLVSILLYLALYLVLRQVYSAQALTALAIGLLAVAALIAARPVLEIFSLSDLYTAAASETDQSRYLTAGETLLLQFHGAAWHTYMLLGAVASLINAVLMLRSPHFGRTLAYIGIVTFTINALFWLPVLGILLLFVAMIGSVPWYILLARDFFRLSRKTSTQESTLI